MHDATWLLIAAFVAAALGMGWLALSMEAHWEQAGARGQPRAGLLRLLGSAALAASLALCLAADHASMAALVWPMTLGGAAALVAFTLTWRPRLLVPLTAGTGRPH